MFVVGDWVIVPDGRSGCVVRVYQRNIVLVQFGSDGPFEKFSRWDLRRDYERTGP